MIPAIIVLGQDEKNYVQIVGAVLGQGHGVSLPDENFYVIGQVDFRLISFRQRVSDDPARSYLESLPAQATFPTIRLTGWGRFVDPNQLVKAAHSLGSGAGFLPYPIRVPVP